MRIRLSRAIRTGLRKQQVVVLGDGTVQAVLDRQHSSVRSPGDDALEDLSRDGAGQQSRVVRPQNLRA